MLWNEIFANSWWVFWQVLTKSKLSKILSIYMFTANVSIVLTIFSLLCVIFILFCYYVLYIKLLKSWNTRIFASDDNTAILWKGAAAAFVSIILTVPTLTVRETSRVARRAINQDFHINLTLRQVLFCSVSMYFYNWDIYCDLWTYKIDKENL